MWQAHMPTQSGTEVCYSPGTGNFQQAAAAKAFSFLLLSQCRSHSYVLSANGLKKLNGRDVFSVSTSMPKEKVSAIIANIKQSFPGFTATVRPVVLPVLTSLLEDTGKSTDTPPNLPTPDGEKNV